MQPKMHPRRFQRTAMTYQGHHWRHQRVTPVRYPEEVRTWTHRRSTDNVRSDCVEKLHALVSEQVQGLRLWRHISSFSYIK